MSKIIILTVKIIKNIFKENVRWFQALEVVYISYNTGTCALPDIYVLALGLHALGHRAYISGNALLPVL